jgi:hypothetical protein
VISPARAAALAFLTAFTTLYAQVLVHRLVSLKLVNNLAFLVVSLTMLGFAVSGVLLTRWQQALLRRRSEAIVAAAALFAISMVGVSAAFAHAPAGAQWAGSRLEFLGAFLRVAPLALLYAIPFTFSGLVLGLLLASPDLPTARVYFADLLGSGAGALAVIPSIGIFGVETALMAAAAAFVVGTAALCGPRDRRVRAVTAAALALVGLAALAPGAFFDMRYPAGSVLDATRHPGSGFVLEHVAWDPVARVELTRIPTPSPQTVAWPYLVGDDARLLSQFRRLVTQNNTAFTYAPSWDGRPESLAGVDRTLYAAAYQASGIERPRVLVVGVGGGFDVLTALRSDATVDAVEVNRATVEILRHTYRDEFRAWVEDPRVRLRHAEGRHLLSTTTSLFDVIQLSGVDSVSGTPAAARVFSENYLYTQEAFDLLLSRLSEDGIVNMMRTEYRPPREMLRALVTATAALRRAGATRPADHVAMLLSNDGLFAALLVKRSAFRDVEIARLQAWAATNPFFRLAAYPGRSGQPDNAYAAFLSLNDPRLEAAFVARYPFDIRPVSDDRPFFFRYSYWWHLFTSDPWARSSVPALELGLLSLLAVAAPAATACVALPLHRLAGAGLRVPHAGRFAIFFAAIGTGFMAVELALLQKLGLFLGHPNHALAVVLAALLVSAGVGSLASARIVEALRGLRFVGYLLSAVVLIEVAVVLDRLVVFLGRPFALRVVLVAALVAPVGLLQGAYFPTGLARLKGASSAFVPWAWGLNGAFSVLAPIAGIAVSVTWGFQSLLVGAIPAYLVAGFALPDRLAAAGERDEAGAARHPAPRAP